MNAHNDSGSLAGPLRGLRVVEFAGIGPGPFAGMLLSDMGADVVRIDRPGSGGCDPRDFVSRGRRLVRLDLKSAEGREQALALVEHADALIEGFRPGVMERLGLGPNDVGARNPRLVYGRMTGWGQTGPLAKAAGHDINYIALSGALAAIGPEAGDPVPPLNLVGDYGGGALYLVVGLLAALHEARGSGRGQVVDAAMCDGAASLMTQFFALAAMGRWKERRGANFLDGGAHFYGVYECADGRHIAVGAIEPQFYATLRDLAGLDSAEFVGQHDETHWPALRGKLAAVIRTRTRDEWCRLLEGSDACVAPVLSMSEAPKHPHLEARGTFIGKEMLVQPAPAPRFSRTPTGVPSGPPRNCSAALDVVDEWRLGGR
ncbi:MAG: CoA transferase [Rhodanobacteraceae bacterium]